MKMLFCGFSLSVLTLITGCTTASKVQNMIDASHRDYLARFESHEASIGVLKKSSVTALEMGKNNDERIAALITQIEELAVQQNVVRDYAEASKIMSAANTVKVAGLEAEVEALQERVRETVTELSHIDQLQETVMIRHYQRMIESASIAIETLQTDDVAATNDVSSTLDEAIEIVAPNVLMEMNE